MSLYSDCNCHSSPAKLRCSPKDIPEATALPGSVRGLEGARARLGRTALVAQRAQCHILLK